MRISDNIDARERLAGMVRGGRHPLGIFVSSHDAAVTEICASAGFDYVILDREHGAMSLMDLTNHVRAAEAGKIVPLVRILEATPFDIQANLDAGAHGIVIPHVEDAETARVAVAASRYAPEGTRGICPGCHAGGYTMAGWSDYARRANRNIVVIPIIESRRAVENIDEIVRVDGIDIVLFGQGDLSADMNIDYNTELHLLREAFEKVRDAAHAAGKYVMVQYGLYEGADVLIGAMDLVLLHDACSKLVENARAGSAPGKGKDA